MKHKNIPIFIPHLGCPNMCVFCNQKSISGHEKFQIEKVYTIIDDALKTIDHINDEVEIAFFGGSFTGIDRQDMLYLLSAAKSYIDKGLVASIRLSTRPDYIDEEILRILKEHGVRNIELGVQSMDDCVLFASKRGHTSEQTRKACQLIKKYGFNLVGQMMLGLPGSSKKLEMETAAALIDCKVDAVRIYPTVVFCHTELQQMLAEGTYRPLELDDAAERAGYILDLLDNNNIPCIRCGLQSQENLADENTVCAGAYHPAFGSMAFGRLMRIRIEKKLADIGVKEYKNTGAGITYKKALPITVEVNPDRIGDAMGYKKENKNYFYHKYNVIIKVEANNTIKGFDCNVKI